MWSGKPTITVAVRVRPLNPKEKRASKDVLKVLDRKVVVVKDPAFESADFLRVNRARDRRYAFDYAFGPECNQQVVYDNTTRFLIDGVLAGYNATVFAYGATGAGKTYTMLGKPTSPGIMILTLEDLYRKIETMENQDNMEFKVTLSYVEIYNEQIRDLFKPQSGYLDLREDPVKGPQVANVTELEATSPSEVMELLAQGNRYRTQESTAANQESSRSHAILQILIQQKERMGKNVKIGKLSLIDLAGSERASRTKNRGQRLVEGANINRSLLALGNVITALAQGKKGSYINFRDSKLTRMLKDSLGGNCRTVMITNVSPAESSFEETINTLKYANRAKNIKTKVSQNVTNVNYHISEYENLISGLREEIANLRAQVAEAKTTTGGSGKYFNEEERELTEEEVEMLNEARQSLANNFRERQNLIARRLEIQAKNVQWNVKLSKWRLQKAEYTKAIRMRRASSVQASREAGFGAEEMEKKLAAEDEKDEDIGAAMSLEERCAEVEQDIMENNSLKENVEKMLHENEVEALRIRARLEALMTNKERRETLRMSYRVYALKIQKMHLQHTNVLHEQLMKQRNLDLQYLRLQLEARDRVISQAQALLGSLGYPDALDLTEIAEVNDTMASFEAAGRVQEEVIAINHQEDEATDEFKKEEMPISYLQNMYGGTMGKGGATARLFAAEEMMDDEPGEEAPSKDAKVAPLFIKSGLAKALSKNPMESAGDEWEDDLYLPPVGGDAAGRRKESAPSGGIAMHRGKREPGGERQHRTRSSDEPLESRSDGLKPRKAPVISPEFPKAFSTDALGAEESHVRDNRAQRNHRRRPGVMAPVAARGAARQIVSKRKKSHHHRGGSPSGRNRRNGRFGYGKANGEERKDVGGLNVSDVELEKAPTPRRSPINVANQKEENAEIRIAGQRARNPRSPVDQGFSDPEASDELSPYSQGQKGRFRPKMAAADVGGRRSDGAGYAPGGRGVEGMQLVGEGVGGGGYREAYYSESMAVAQKRIGGAMQKVNQAAIQRFGRREDRQGGGGRLKQAGSEVVKSRSDQSQGSSDGPPPSVVGKAVSYN